MESSKPPKTLDEIIDMYQKRAEPEPIESLPGEWKDTGYGTFEYVRPEPETCPVVKEALNISTRK